MDGAAAALNADVGQTTKRSSRRFDLQIARLQDTCCRENLAFDFTPALAYACLLACSHPLHASCLVLHNCIITY